MVFWTASTKISALHQPCQNVLVDSNFAAYRPFLATYSTLDFTMSSQARVQPGVCCLLILLYCLLLQNILIGLLHTWIWFTLFSVSDFPFQLTISSTVVMSHLMRFDARFSALLQIPIKIDPSKAPPEPMKTHQTVTSTKRKRTETDQDSSKYHKNIMMVNLTVKNVKKNKSLQEIWLTACNS